MKRIFTSICLLVTLISYAQNTSTQLLKTILTEYYASEKVVIKGRVQFLFVYCDKANNNESLMVSVQELNLPKATSDKIRVEIKSDTKTEDWRRELDAILSSDANLASKVNDCLTLEEYQQEREKRNLNHQRMMIVSKPVLFNNGKSALVKVVFYRTIEHNSGSVLLLEKENNNWVIKKRLNPWKT